MISRVCCLLFSALLAAGSGTAAGRSHATALAGDARQTGFDSIVMTAAACAEEIVDGYIVPVSGNAELDAYLDEILDTVVGRDEDALRRAFDWVGNYDNFEYADMDYFEFGVLSDEQTIACALEMCENHEGNCYRYAALMCWISRALGYDARTVSGEVLMRNGWVLHGWVEVAVDGEALLIDPQQHAREGFEDLDLFMVTYDEASLYYEID